MKVVLVAVLVLAIVGAPVGGASHPCDDSDCSGHEPTLPHCRGYPGSLVKTVILCVQEALP